MGNEGQSLPPSQQNVSEQQPRPYYGWQYAPDDISPAPLSPPLPSLQSLPSTPAVFSEPSRLLRTYGTHSGPLGETPLPPQPLPKPQQSLVDMGASLGYGQGMEYQYVNTPQPSQPLPVLREARLQQLRAERERRQPQGGSLDLTSSLLHKATKPSTGLFSAFRASHRSSLSANRSTPWGSPLSSGPSDPAASQSFTEPPILPRGPSGQPLLLPSRPQPAIAGQKIQQQTPGPQNALIGWATLILTGSFIIGRVLGLLRTSLLAFVFGASATSDAYLQAFLLPDLIFTVVAGGALSSAFIPVFTQYLFGEKDEKTAWRIASIVLNLTLAVLCCLALIAAILAPGLVGIYDPGLHNPAEMNLIVSLTRILLVQSVIMGGGVIINSLLSARQDFLRPAVGTVLYHMGLVIGLLPGALLVFLGRNAANYTSFAVYAATWGAVFGAILQVGVQIPGLLKERKKYSFTFDWQHPAVQQIGRQMLPRVLNAAMFCISTFVDRILILLLVAGPLLAHQTGLITEYYLALQLFLLPLGIFGMAVSTAAFPTMAEDVSLGRLDRVRTLIEETLRSILFLSLPTSVTLIVLGLPLIQVLFQHGSFGLDAATSTSIPLAFFAFGLVGLATVEILTRSFYAFRDGKTPVIVSIAQFLLKILLSLIFLGLMQWGPAWKLGALALATSGAGLLEAAVLLWLLQKKMGRLNLRQLLGFTGRVCASSLILAGGLIFLRILLDLMLNTTDAESLGTLGVILTLFKLLFELVVGVLVYVWATRQLGIENFWRQGPIRRLLEGFKLSWV